MQKGNHDHVDQIGWVVDLQKLKTKICMLTNIAIHIGSKTPLLQLHWLITSSWTLNNNACSQSVLKKCFSL